MIALGRRVERLEALKDFLPGMVERKGDDDKAEKVYSGFKASSGDDVAAAIYWPTHLPSHVNINSVELMPVQLSFNAFNIHRGES